MMNSKIYRLLYKVNILWCAYCIIIIGFHLLRGDDPIIATRLERVDNPLYGIPPVTQESIDWAINAYEIEIPWNAWYPTIDYESDTEEILGSALVSPMFLTCIPTVTPGAFNSWGKLAAILAHEIEVHCNQNMIMRLLKHGNDIEYFIEREAYQYMIDSRRRFNLSDQEVLNIKLTMNFHYPLRD